jgi:hypothetical protein
VTFYLPKGDETTCHRWPSNRDHILKAIKHVLDSAKAEIALGQSRLDSPPIFHVCPNISGGEEGHSPGGDGTTTLLEEKEAATNDGSTLG